jgi:hypothetical protein
MKGLITWIMAVYSCYSNILFVTAVILLMPGLHGILVAGVPVYSVLLMTMIWRATARVQFFEVSITVCSGAKAVQAVK